MANTTESKPLTQVEKRLCVMILKMAKQALRNDDFNLVTDAGLTPEEAYQIRLEFWRYNGPPGEGNPEPKSGDTYLADWAVAAYLAHRCQEA